VLLLPHGYEGQGPDHSSARIERYLQLAAQNNMTIARPSTPASYFHLLRRQAYARPRKPLIVFTPKAMLRLRGATSELAEFTSGRFQPVLDDPDVTDKAAVRRVLVCAGKLYYDLKAELAKAPNPEIAVVRLEQFYPLPKPELEAVLDSYPNAEFVWTQDEPENQGAAPYIVDAARRSGKRDFRVVSRPASASPAVGTAKRHAVEQAKLMKDALTL
jgi:2-oxoglutarate dehydrogenase E1 component